MKKHREKIEKPGDFVRQGDIALIRVAAIPTTAKPKKRAGRIVLAEGEVTGHAHAILEENVTEHEVDGLRFFDVVKAAVRAIHDEHSTHVLEPGPLELRQQCELGDDDEPRVVRD